MTSAAVDGELRAAVEARTPLIRDTTTFITRHPELAHEERVSSAYLADTLAELGLAVDRGVFGMDTCFRAVLRGGRPGRTVGLVVLFDAVAAVPPEGGLVPVHSCGHASIAGGIVGAAAALAAMREQLAGTVVVMGCPADEIHAPATVARGGGKPLTVAAGGWDGIDAALYVHPEPIDTVWTESAWMRRETALVAGLRSLAKDADQPPLDAAMAAVMAARRLPAGEVMLEHMVLDGDVEEGGGVVMRAHFLIWAPHETGLDQLAGELRAALPAEWNQGATVSAIRVDERVRSAVAEAQRAAGRDYVDSPPALPFATDFGAITRHVPGALIGVARAGGWSFHTPQGAREFASEDGIRSAADMAEVIALSTRRLTEPS